MTPLTIVRLWVLLLLGTTLIAQTSAVPEINFNHRAFADALTAELYQNENDCTSAWGVSLCFDLVYPASIREAASQIQSVFRYPTESSQLQLVWQDTSSRIDNAYEGECLDSQGGDCSQQAPTLAIANRIWVDNDTSLNATYAEVVGEFVRQIDFSDAGAGGVINGWVEDSTNGLIDSVVEEGPLNRYLLIAVNSIYLKASWLYQFYDQHTNEDVFYTSPSRMTKIESPSQFMHQVEFFPYSHTALLGFQIVQLPLAGGDLSMLFVLPTSDDSGTASSSSVLSALPQLTSTKLALALPKFKFESKYEEELKSSLKALGLMAPFEGDLCILEGDCSSLVDLVVQKTVIDVNEKGVEAAAVTAIGVPTSAPPPERPILVLMDHPFQFFIYDAKEELVLFEGRVGAPPIPSSSTAAPLPSSHADANFWTKNFGVDPELPDFGGVVLTDPPTLPPTTPSPTPEPTTPSPAPHILSFVASVCVAILVIVLV